MKPFVATAALGLAGMAMSQVPDVQVKADLGPVFRNQVNGGSDVHWYDPFGHHSTIALLFALEPGFRAYVSQKIERIRRDGDPSPIDESYVEDAGIWRAGKQYLPFGAQRIFRESVVAIRSDTDLFLRELPMKVAACDGGAGRQRGIVGRIGRSLGVSFALGQHFGISGTSLTQARLPSQSIGADRGYRNVFGVDVGRQLGPFFVSAEGALFREGEAGAPDTQVIDLTATLTPDPKRSLTLGYSLTTHPGVRSFRIQGSMALENTLWLEPWIRTRNGRIYDSGVSVRVRL